MKIGLLSCSHFIIWGSFSTVLLLSTRDKMHYKVLLFFVFLYVAYVVAYVMLHSRKKALFFTLGNSMLFLFIRLTFL